MIEKLYNAPHLLHQAPDDDAEISESPIAVSIDAGGTLILSQEGRHICVNWASVPELTKLLRDMRKLNDGAAR